MNFIKMDWDSWEEKYQPQENHLDDNASANGWMYETYDEELDYVKEIYKTEPGKVWTYLGCDGVLIIANGFRHVNRMGYFITAVPCEPDTEIEVEDDDD